VPAIIDSGESSLENQEVRSKQTVVPSIIQMATMCFMPGAFLMTSANSRPGDDGEAMVSHMTGEWLEVVVYPWSGKIGLRWARQA
jgi:hypothetical protein